MLQVFSHSGFGDGVRRLDEIFHLPLFEKLVAVEAGIDEYVRSVRALQQPDHHLDVQLTRPVRAGDQSGNGKVRDDTVADRVDFVRWLGRFVLRRYLREDS